MMRALVSGLLRVAAAGCRYLSFEYPSQWAQREYHISEQTGSENPGRIDVWRMPANVGIMDACVEPKRGVLVLKCVQCGLSTAMVAVLGYFIARVGGSMFYCLQKLETMRLHSITRIEPMIERSPELVKLALKGRDGKETILAKMFRTGSLILTSASAESNFISNAYSVMFLDEYDKMGIFPSGNDAKALSEGRQEQILSPKLFGFSSGDHPEVGICSAVAHDSDRRQYFVECPHCRNAVTIDPERDIVMDNDDNGKPLVDTARMQCSACQAVITDTQRARALVHAAQSAAVWYDAVPDRGDLGWRSVMTPEEAATRDYAGFEGYSQLLNPRQTVKRVAKRMFTCRTEAEKKTVWNDVVGKGYATSGSSIGSGDVERVAGQSDIPADTWKITFGADIQFGGGEDVVAYYDIAAWRPNGHKITLQMGTIKATEAKKYRELINFVKTWQRTTADGKNWRIQQGVIDAGYKTKVVYYVCNQLSPPKRGLATQWMMPVIYNHQKLGEAHSQAVPQSEKIGDPNNCVTLLSRNWLVSRAIDRVLEEQVILPSPISEEVKSHYSANVLVDDHDRHGNFRGRKWVKQQVQKGVQKDDDYLQAAAYTEYAAIMLGLDTLLGVELEAAHQAAEEVTAKRRDVNSDEYRRQRSRDQSDRVKVHQSQRKRRMRR